MSWTTLRRRHDVLRAVTRAADERRDGILPTDLTGVREVFPDDLALLGALSLRWSTHLAARVDGALHEARASAAGEQASDPEATVVAAWRRAAAAMPGTRAVLDRALEQPGDDRIARSLRTAADKEHAMLAVASGLAGAGDPASARRGEALVRDAGRAGAPPFQEVVDLARAEQRSHRRLLRRLRSVLAA